MVLHNFDMTYDFKSFKYFIVLSYYPTKFDIIHVIAQIQKGGGSRDKGGGSEVCFGE